LSTFQQKEVEIESEFPARLAFLFEPHRYKIAYGGRYGVKSWSFARALLHIGIDPSLLWPSRTQGPRILCARETQKSIAESVHKLLSDQIAELRMESKYTVQQSSISAKNGAEFIFAGIRQNVTNIKSYEACDICWVEEAQTVSKNSWNVLVPTIRKEGSEIWVSFNPELETDETYQRFVTQPPTNSVVRHTTFRDNPWLSEVMRQEMRDLKQRDPSSYDHVYEGQCKQAVEGAIYRAEITATELEGRFTHVPHDSTRPVDTYWDLGYGDNTSIWFAQSFPFEFRVIDHLSASLKGLDYYVKEMKAKPYAYGRFVLPHDGAAHELGSGKSIEEQLRSHFPGNSVTCAKKLSVTDGIAACRAIFSKCVFDRERCADGIQSLRHYRYEEDEKLGTFKREPLHDWASHDADAFRTMAVSIKEQARPRPAPQAPVARTRWS
jgi:phage terminase large subunit